MKRFIMLVASVALFSFAQAQNKNVQSAINYLKDYDADKSIDDLLEAKKYIDEASSNEETKAKAKTWSKRAEVYKRLYALKDKDEKVKALNIDMLEELYTSYKQLFTYSPEKKGEYYEQAVDGLGFCAGFFFNAGADEYKAQNYANAVKKFEASIGVNKDALNRIDTIGIYYAALSADKGNMNDKAKEYYKRAIEVQYGKSAGEIEMVRPYYFLAQIFKKEKNDAEYLNTLKTARQSYPNNKDLLNEEMNYYISSGKLNDAIKSIDEAITKEPSNKNNYLNKSILYDNLANPKDGKKLDDKSYDDYFTKAVESAKKGYELDSTYYDVAFQIGALYYNKGVRQTEYANTITGISAAEQKKYEAESKKADVLFRQSLPYFEKCEKLGNSDKETLKQLYITMKQIYQFTEQPEKMKAIKAKMDAM
jgi:hypothetical protein